MALTDPNSGANAYVGPQPFPQTRQLYGRDRELLALTNRLLSERLVLFYSPSGAGKTSLIQAKGGLRDRMTTEGFVSLPAIRVSHAAPVAAAKGVNRYLLSALISLELARPEGDRRTAEDLAKLLQAALEDEQPFSFHEFLIRLNQSAVKGARVQTFLVLDQFEELLTLDPTDDEAKREFLRQVGVALRDGDRWALFVMREDYVGQLDPLLPLLPSRLAVTFRLDLLRLEAAEEAICKPSAEFGVTFEPAAVKNLVHELARILVQDPLTGESQQKAGLYVEPLHLQLVCQRLWKERKFADRITAEDLDRLAHDQAEDVRGVAAALAHYYDDSIQAVATQFAAQGVTERAIRGWFRECLISCSGLRLPVLLGNELEYGLSGPVLRALADRYLIRAEQRHGAIYYELAHDRLVVPIQKSNDAWRKRLAAFQQAAEVWKENGKKSDLLVADEVLAEGERLERLPSFSKDDRMFLDACRAAREARRNREERKQAQRRKRWYIAIAVAVGCCCVAAIRFEMFRSKTAEAAADRLGKINDAYGNYVSAWQTLIDDPARSFDHATQALKLFEDAAKEPPGDLKTKVLQQASASRAMQTLGVGTIAATAADDQQAIHQHKTAITDIVLAGKDRHRLVTRETNGWVLGWDQILTQQVPSLPSTSIPAVNQMMATPNGRYLLVGHSYGHLSVHDMEDKDMKELDDENPQNPLSDAQSKSPVTSLYVAESGGTCHAIAGHKDGNVQLFDCDQAGRVTPVGSPWHASGCAISTVILSSNGELAFTQDRVGNVQSREKNTPQKLKPFANLNGSRIVAAHGQDLFATADTPDVQFYRLASDLFPLRPIEFFVNAMNKAPIYERNRNSPNKQESILKDIVPKVKIVTFGPSLVKTGNQSSMLMFVAWPIPAGFSPEKGEPSHNRVYEVDPKAGRTTLIHSLPPDVEQQQITVAGFSEDGKRIAVGLDDGSIRIWQLDDFKEDPRSPLKGYSSSPVTALLVAGANGEWIFTGQADGKLRRWSVPK